MSIRTTICRIIVGVSILASSTGWPAEGFYKDIFIDGGCYLTARESLAAAEYLDLTTEALFTPYDPVTADHLELQASIFVGDENDSNGRLLYPDGSPRFRMIQTNGGSATQHGRSLGEDGRQRVRDFYANGGSYTGTCAGFFIATLAAFEDGINENYYHIWPGRSHNTGLTDAYTGMFIEEGSPLLDYFDFGGDLYVDTVRHNGGGYADEYHPDWPEGTEILARYDYPGWSMHEQVSCLAYKEDDLSGRLVIIGSHPEGVASGERRDLMSAMILYALDGQGEVQLKGELDDGVWRTMDRYWDDDEPMFARIGDKQYHHFAIEVPWGTTRLSVQLEGEVEYDLDLYLAREQLALASTAEASSTTPEAAERIDVEDPEVGRWYIGVECYSTVTATVGDGYVEYSGDLGVLDGVAYSIMAELEIERYLILDLPEEVVEGSAAVFGRIEAVPEPPDDWEIALDSSDNDQIVFPDSLSFQAGRANVTFEIEAVNDDTRDGDHEVVVTACAQDYECGSDRILVVDDDVSSAVCSCADQSGTCCQTGETCSGGTFLESSDCGWECCVGGICEATGSDEEPSDPPDGQDQNRTTRQSTAGCACQANQADLSWSSFLLTMLTLLVTTRRRHPCRW